MRRSITVAVLALMPILTVGCQPVNEESPEQAEIAAPDPVARGAFLVSIMGCDDCHTPKIVGPEGPVPDMSRRLMGHSAEAELGPPPELTGGWMAVGNADLTAWHGPWGNTYATNLTPDESTGMGIWTDQMFIDAMRTGRHMGTARPIMPPMPWQGIGNLSDDDLRALLAFLKSLPPISNEVPQYEPPVQ